MGEWFLLASSSWLDQPASLKPKRSHSTSNVNPKKIPYRYKYRPFLWKRFLNYDSLFPDMSRLCQTDKNQQTSDTIAILSLPAKSLILWLLLRARETVFSGEEKNNCLFNAKWPVLKTYTQVTLYKQNWLYLCKIMYIYMIHSIK